MTDMALILARIDREFHTSAVVAVAHEHYLYHTRKSSCYALICPVLPHFSGLGMRRVEAVKRSSSRGGIYSVILA